MIVTRRKELLNSTSLQSHQPPVFELHSKTCSFRGIFLVEDGGLSDRSRNRLVDAALGRTVSLSCPEVDPLARREVDLYAAFARVEHRRDHELGAYHELVLQAGHLRVVGIVDKWVPEHREARL